MAQTVASRIERRGGDLYERDKRGWRKKHPEGGWVYRPLRTLLGEVFKANDPILANITFFIGLRNQIEHRHESQIAALVACKTQALLINYESSLVDFFGGSEALGTELRFLCSSPPSPPTPSKRSRRPGLRFLAALSIGSRTSKPVSKPASPLTSGSTFQIYLIPHTGPKSTADAALTFVRADQFTPEQNAIMEQVQTIIVEKKVPVEDLNGMPPRAVVEQVSKRLDKPFTMHTHAQAWRYYKVRRGGTRRPVRLADVTHVSLSDGANAPLLCQGRPTARE